MHHSTYLSTFAAFFSLAHTWHSQLPVSMSFVLRFVVQFVWNERTQLEHFRFVASPQQRQQNLSCFTLRLERRKIAILHTYFFQWFSSKKVQLLQSTNKAQLGIDIFFISTQNPSTYCSIVQLVDGLVNMPSHDFHRSNNSTDAFLEGVKMANFFWNIRLWKFDFHQSRDWPYANWG